MQQKDELQKLKTRIAYLEEMNQSTLDVLDLMVNVRDRMLNKPLDISLSDSFKNTNLLINRFLPLQCSACYLVNEINYAFELQVCSPKSKAGMIKKEIKEHIADGTFAWAIRQKQPVIVPAKHLAEKKIIFQTLRGKSRVIGMYAGLFSGNEPVQGGVFLDLFSIMMHHFSQSLENAKLYTAINEREAMARALLNASKDAAILLNPDGSIINMNKAAADRLNVKTDDFTGLNFLKLLPRKIAKSRSIIAKKVIETGQPEQFVDEMNERVIDNIYYPIFNDKGNVHHLAIYARDITEKLEAIEERRILEHKLMEQTRLANIGLLTSGIAHNLRGPLAAMMGQVALCEMDYPELKEWATLQTLCNNMNRLIDNMMVKSRQDQENKKTSINLNELLRTELNFLDADLDFKHNIEKKYHFQEDLPTIMGKYSDFSQALMNIVNNAIDAMHECKEKCLHVITESDDQNIVIKVIDTGCGICKEDMPKLFTPFFSTKASRSCDEKNQPRGTGLGLYSSYTLLKEYNAQIVVDSQINEGTTFKISIPLQNKD